MADDLGVIDDVQVARVVQDDLLHQAAVLVKRAGYGAWPFIAAVVALFWARSSHMGLIAWAGLSVLMTVVSQAQVRRILGGRVETGRDTTRMAAVAGVTGACYGLLPVLALPRSDEWKALMLVCVFGLLAANSIYGAPIRRVFVTYQLTLVVAGAVGFAAAGEMFGYVLAGWVVYGGCFTLPLHSVAHAEATRATTAAHRNERLAEMVADEQQALREANDQLAAMNAELAHRATHDPLTGLANRALFGEMVSAALARRSRSSRHLAVLFIDLDRFKVVNDSLGHGVGDRLLCMVAERVQPLLSPGDVLARLGGDEFTILLNDLADVDDALATAERVAAALRSPFVVGGRELQITPSIGVAADLDHRDDFDDLLRHADAALYRAKERGRDRVEAFDEGMRERLDRRLEDEQALRRAFGEQQIVAWYQPIVDIATGEIMGAEALARWDHPTQGLLPAGRFVDLIDECGLDLALNVTMFTAGVGFRIELLDHVPRPFRVRMNANPRAFTRENVDRLLNGLVTLGCPPEGLAVEVTEHAIVSELGEATRLLGELRAAGVAVELDDFGTGHSSLTLLANLPLDGIKIDRSFVAEVITSARNRAVIDATVDLAAGLGLSVVAEGVETREQAHALADMGVTLGQGYLWAPAVPADQLRSWITEGTPWGAPAATPEGAPRHLR